jgi:radical SAM-linked protein
VPDAPAAAPPPPVVAEPRQRWRLIVARAADAVPQTQRELADAWEAALIDAGLPLARTADERSRAKVSFGAPLPSGMAAEGELIDLVLTERWPAWRLREAIEPVVPPGWRLVDAHDVWLAGPALAGRVAAADYRVTLAPTDPPEPDLAGRLTAAGEALLAARRLERQRRKGDGVVSYDLRPLLVGVAVRDGDPITIVTRTRLHPELGSGRPEEVIGALGDFVGRDLGVVAIARERLVLAEDLESSD